MNVRKGVKTGKGRRTAAVSRMDVQAAMIRELERRVDALEASVRALQADVPRLVDAVSPDVALPSSTCGGR